jgi:hypothetical protein
VQILPVQGQVLEMNEASKQKLLRKAFALADSIGLSKDERYELVSIAFAPDSASWKDIPPEDLSALVYMLEGYAFINYLLSTRED